MDYNNIEIVWKRGKRAIMTIMDDNGTTIEDVKLYALKTREDMHKLMEEKGFSKKTKVEKMAEVRQAATEYELDHMTNGGLQQSMFSMYLVICIVGTVIALFISFGRKQTGRSRGSSKYNNKFSNGIV